MTKLGKKAEAVYFLSIYILFMALDIVYKHSLADSLKYVFIVSCFLYSLKNIKKCRFVSVALFCTCICDYFLLFTQKFSVGIFVFCVVMCIYIYGFTKNKYLPILLFAIYGVAAYIINPSDFPPVAIAYALLFYSNLFICLKKYIRKNIIIPAAFILFALCDIFVASYNITGNEIYMPFMWFFYAPSQYIIAHFFQRDVT